VRAILVSLIYIIMIILTYGFIMTEILDETKTEREVFASKVLRLEGVLNHLSDGLILIEKNKVEFMNEVSNKIFANVPSFVSFGHQKEDETQVKSIDSIVFVIYYENDTKLLFGRKMTKAAKKKREYSLRDIMSIDAAELSQMVFTLNDQTNPDNSDASGQQCYSVSKIQISPSDILLQIKVMNPKQLSNSPSEPKEPSLDEIKEMER
jgi:hypothetical protein